MTDKQIIIDGVDVSGCEKQGETINGITCGNGERIRLANEIITKHKLCKDSPNCIYKQHKRDEQCIVELNKTIHAKEQECERLKEEKQGLIKNWEEKKNLAYEIACKNEKLKAENEKLDTENKRLVAELANPVFDSFKELDKLKQTLAEIKALAIVLKNICPEFIKDGNDSMKAINEILQKISEVEDETT